MISARDTDGMMSRKGVSALIFAAVRRARAGDGPPKQYRRIGGAPVLRHAVQAFADHPEIDAVQVVIHPDDSAAYADAVSGLDKLLAPCSGGETRAASVRAGLASLSTLEPAIVLVHDAARPFLSADLIGRAIAAARNDAAAIPVLPVVDTIKTVDGAGRVVGTPERATLRAAQTPQAFHFPLLVAAHDHCARLSGDFTDDAAIMEAAGHRIATFAGDPGNMKLTTPDDFASAALRINAPAEETRVGQGYDVHAFGTGDHVMLGGVRFPHDRGVVAHSDGDVVLHALTDALLGVIGAGDIGAHFPPSDPQWRNVASERFLAFAAAQVAARGGVIVHLDVTIICEAPKIGPGRDAMRAEIARIAGLDVGRVAVKATTSERMGFTGRREGLAALALATVRLPAAP